MNRELIICIDDIIKSWNPKPAWYRFGDTWESIEVPEGYEKPPKEEFEAKLQELIDAQPWKELRAERNKRLTECDWVTLRSVATDTPIPDEWKVYMQALRDLPANTADPENPTWPEPPSNSFS
jgi:hypothetical protein